MVQIGPKIPAYAAAFTKPLLNGQNSFIVDYIITIYHIQENVHFKNHLYKTRRVKRVKPSISHFHVHISTVPHNRINRLLFGRTSRCNCGCGQLFGYIVVNGRLDFVFVDGGGELQCWLDDRGIACCGLLVLGTTSCLAYEVCRFHVQRIGI